MLEVREMTIDDYHLFASIESSLETNERFVVSYKDEGFEYDYQVVDNIRKVYKACEMPVKDYFSSENHHILFAYIEDEFVGQITVWKHWNKTCYIDDIRVKADHKGMGVGQALLEVSMDWAMDNGLKAMMLETQDVNAPACKFYLKNGFEIGGIDKYMYKYLGGPETHETAILFYKSLEEVE